MNVDGAPRSRWVLQVLVIGAVLILGSLVVFATASRAPIGGSSGSPPAEPTKGPIPESAWTDNGVDLAQVPDFVSALDQDGNVAGYIAKLDILDPDGGRTPDHVVTGFQPDPPIPVLGGDLETLVGHHYGGVGFVPLGEDPPTLEEQQAGVTFSSGGPDTDPATK